MTFARRIRLSLIAPHGAGPLPAPHALDAETAEQSTDPAVNRQLDATLAAHLDVVYRYAMRLTGDANLAQELTQETMLRGWKSRRSLQDEQAAKSWLLRIATNLWTDQLRRKPQQPQLFTEPPACQKPNTTSKLIQKENVQRALTALDELPSRQRQVMHLITVEQLTHAEVAEILSLTPQAVKSNLAAARRTLREKLQDLYDEVRGAETCRKTNANNSKPT